MLLGLAAKVHVAVVEAEREGLLMGLGDENCKIPSFIPIPVTQCFGEPAVAVARRESAQWLIQSELGGQRSKCEGGVARHFVACKLRACRLSQATTSTS